jgi:hypothetical protein
MDATTQRIRRPMTVNLGLAILLVDAARHIIPTVLYGHWDNPSVNPLLYVKFGSEFAILLLPLWFIFRGKNWARWLMLAFFFGGFCVSLPEVMRHFEAHSTGWIVTYCCVNMILFAAVVAFFLPASGRWFQGHRDANLA